MRSAAPPSSRPQPRNRGVEAKRTGRRPCIHANLLQGLPIAVLSVFELLEQELALVRAPGLAASGGSVQCSMVRAPSPEEEDRQRLTRERGTLLKERIQHTNRIRGLLSGQGARDYNPLLRDRFERDKIGDIRPVLAVPTVQPVAKVGGLGVRQIVALRPACVRLRSGLRRRRPIRPRAPQQDDGQG